MKRKWIGILLLSCTIWMLGGCSQSTSASEEETASTEEAESEEEEAGEETGSEETISEETTEETTGETSSDSATLLLEWKTTQYFTDEAVAEEDIEAILEAGINTTSAMNGQPWHFSAVTDTEVLSEIADAMSQGMGGGVPSGSGDASGPDLLAETLEESGEGTESEELEEIEEFEDVFSSASGEEAVTDTGEAQEETTVRSKAGIADAPLAIIVSCLEGSDLDAGLATQSMFIEARLLGYGAKIISSPTMVLNGDDAESYSELLGIPEGYSVVSVLLVGYEDTSVDTSLDGVTGPSVRNESEEMVTYVE